MERDAGGGVGELVEQSESGVGFLGWALQEFDFTGAAVDDHGLGMAGVGEVSAVFGDVGDEVKGGGEKGCAALFEDGAEVAVDLAQENAGVEGFGCEFLDEGANDGGDEGGPDAMDPRYTIATARPHDLHALAEIELAAATLLRDHVPPAILEEATDEAHLRTAQAAGRLWVALEGDLPVGFAHVEMLADDLPHLEELDVHPRHGRRGIGAALVRAVCEWMRRSGYREITLTTFRAVPWNMPFYARLGFEEVPIDDLRPEVAAVVRDEAARGLDPERRVVMRYR